MRRFSVLFISILSFWCSVPWPVVAAEKPAEITPTISAAYPYGSGVLRYWGFDIYRAQLWTDAPQWNMQTPFALSLEYFVALPKVRMVEETIKQLKTQRDWSANQLEQFEVYLTDALPAVEKKDRVTAIYHPKKPLILFVNGRYYSEIKDPRLLPAFIHIWLGEGNDLAELRADLLNLEAP